MNEVLLLSKVQLHFIEHSLPQVVEPEEVTKQKLSVPHTTHCLGNGNIMISCLGDGTDEPKGK